ncbi:hypothetical protein L1987_85964 [Smallanthus sonchifolius]|uniref:Uncharacterized protein n=1 Tax=Smallanthus sonchifolius TaxID=185202 RepID=A0ACB8XY19_9ASTR|nr:hypothetical protein L1987_85964 [Smallanthus sonchifolius]
MYYTWEIVDFLNRSKISYVITADLIVSRPYLEQFWDTADHDCTVTPNVIRVTVAGHDITFYEDTIRRFLQFRDLATDPISYPGYFVDGCWRQRMGYVGVRDYSSYKKMWVLDQWRFFAHVMIMCISSRKAGKDAMGHDLAAAMVGLSLNRGYNFSRYVYKALVDQINTTESVEPTLEHTPLFGHLINEAYVAPADWIWFSAESEPELSDHSDEQQEEEEVESEDEVSEEGGDEEAGSGVAEESDSKATESDSSDSDDAPSPSQPRRQTQVTLPESSSKRKRQESTRSEYEPDFDSDAAIQRRRRESINKRRGDRQHQAILREVEVSAQRHVTVMAVSTDSTSTSPSQHFYMRQRRGPRVTPDVATTAFTEDVPVIVTLPGFDFGEFFSFPTNQAEVSSSRGPDPRDTRITTLETQVAGLLETLRKSREESDKQQGQINSLIDEVAALKKQRAADDKQHLEHDAIVKLVCDMAKMLATQGERLKELLEKQPPKPSGEEACHLVDLTKSDDQDKDPKAGPSGSEQQSSALAIVPISVVPMAEGESSRNEGGGDVSSGDKGKSVADLLKDLYDDVSDDVILLLEPEYSKEAQIDALYYMEEGEIESGDDWDEEDEDVVIEVPKGDVEGEYEFKDGEIFEAPSIETNLDTGSVELVSTAEASTETSPTDPTLVDPEAQKSKHTPASSSKDPAPVWQKTSIIDKHGATGMILAVRFEDDKKLFAIKQAGGFCRERGRSGKFEVFKPQVPKRVRDKNVRHPVTHKSLKKLVYKPVLCETRIPLSKLSQDILGNIWYWYVDPKTGEAVVIGKVWSKSGSLVSRELIRVFDEVCFINFSVKDLEALADKYCMYTDEWTKSLASK